MNRKINRFATGLITAILFLSGIELAAQEVQKAGLSGENVKAGIQVYEYVREKDGEKNAFGIITETIEKNGENMFITYKQDLPQVVMTDSLIVDFENFLPKSYKSVFFTRQNISVKYNGSESVDVRIKRRSFGVNQDTSYTTEFDQVRYDSHWLPPLLYALSKEEKNNWEIPVYSYNNKEDILRIKLIGEEEVVLHNKNYEALKYEISRQNSPNAYHYWIDKKNQRLLQTRAQVEPGLVIWLRIKPQV